MKEVFKSLSEKSEVNGGAGLDKLDSRCNSLVAHTYLQMNAQGEFDFGNGSADEGYARWLAQRKLAVTEMARQINLPLDHQVEVWLVGGVRLRGKLQLDEERLFLVKDDLQHLKLLVDRVPFSIHEMESCVRLD